MTGTGLNSGGARAPAADLPGCATVSDHGAFELGPAPAADSPEARRALEWILSVGGSVDRRADGAGQLLRPGGRLPDGPFRVGGVEVGANGPDAEAVGNLWHLPTLGAGLSVQRSPVGDAALWRLTGSAASPACTTSGWAPRG